MKQIYFARQEFGNISIWGYNIADDFMANYTIGYNPYPSGEGSVIVTRNNANGRNELWRINFQTGIEECIVSDPYKSFTSPSVSPDENWICFVSESDLVVGQKNYSRRNVTYRNTDIYVCKTDGTQMTQLTYHAADDLSPIWSRDGKYIYFISQRGSTNAVANVWRMDFPY